MLKENIDEFYWLGFIYADGNLCDYYVKSGNNKRLRRTFSLHVSSRDCNHIEKLADILKLKVVDRKSTNAALISTCRKDVVEYLTQHGIQPRKSLSNDIDSLINRIPKERMRDFIRGYFDGDGCITNYIAKHKRGDWNASKVVIVGSEAFIVFLQKQLAVIGAMGWIEEQNGLWKLVIRNKKRILSFRDFIYGDATTFLLRKYEKFNGVTVKQPVKFKKSIYFKHATGKWVAYARADKAKYLGSFPTREEAVSAFNDYVSINT